MSKYPRLRNGKLEGGGLFRPHIFLEEKKKIWVLCESSITSMGIGKACLSMITKSAFLIDKLS